MVWAAILAIVLAAVLACRRQARRAAAERRDWLRDCDGLFDAAPAHGVDRAGLGCLSGRVRGFPVRVGLLAEALAFRRLPQLWLRVELRAGLGGSASLDLVRRPQTPAFDAPGADLPLAHAVPPGWPADTLIRGSAGSQALMARLTAHGAPLLADPRLKQVLLTPRGLRVWTQACEGERGPYLLLRASRFGPGRIARSRVRAVLDETVALAQALSRQEAADAGNDSRRPARHAASV